MDNIRNFTNAKRIVVKIGTSTLIRNDYGINIERIEQIACVLSNIINRGVEVALVTSGAIGVGVGMLGLAEKPKNLTEKQALASIGQPHLIRYYEESFSKYNVTAAQVLLTKDDIDSVRRQQHIMNTFEKLFGYKIVIPIINENDAVAVDEIKFGDNDTLSARVAKLIKADLLIILSDIDGLYKSDPNKNPKAQLIKSVKYIDENIENLAKGSGSKVGTGGMITKISAAKIATDAGIDMAIINGNDPKNIYRLIEGKDIGTLFYGRTKKPDKYNGIDDLISL